jgi:hypothetical protein
MAEKSLEIILRVKDLASQGLKSTGLAVDGLRDKLNNTTTKGGGLGNAAQSLEGLAKLARVVGTIQVAVQTADAAISGIPVAIALATGDMDKLGTSVQAFKEKLSNLPLTIGLGFKVGDQIGQYLFGDERDAKKIQGEIDKIEDRMKRFDAAASKIASARSQAIGIGDTARNVVRNLQTPEALRDQEQVQIDFEGQVKQIEAARADAVKAYRAAGVNDAGIAEQTKVFTEQAIAAEQARDAKIQEIRGKHYDRMVDLVEGGERSALSAQQAGNEAELRLNGDPLAAQLSQIRRNYDEQIRAKQEAAAKLAQDPTISAEAKATIAGNTQAEVAGLTRQRDAEVAAAERDGLEARRRIVEDGEQAIAAIRADIRAGEFRALGRSLDAELAAIDQSYAQQIESTRRAAQEKAKALPAGSAERETVTRQAGETETALEQRRQQERAAAEQRAADDRVNRERISAGQISDIESQLAADRLRAQGKIAEARQAELKTQIEQRKRQIDLDAESRAKANPQEREQIIADAARLKELEQERYQIAAEAERAQARQRGAQANITRLDLSAGIPAPATQARGTSAATQTPSGQSPQQGAARQAETANAGRMFDLAQPVESLDKNVARLVDTATKLLQLVQRGGLVPLEV